MLSQPALVKWLRFLQEEAQSCKALELMRALPRVCPRPASPADLPACPRLQGPAASVMSAALLLSHLLTRALAERPFATSDAPAWFEGTARVARTKLQVGGQQGVRGRGLEGMMGRSARRMRSAWAQLPPALQPCSRLLLACPRVLQETSGTAPKDSLQEPAAIIAAVLGKSNPVAEASGWGGQPTNAPSLMCPFLPPQLTSHFRVSRRSRPPLLLRAGAAAPRRRQLVGGGAAGGGGEGAAAGGRAGGQASRCVHGLRWGLDAPAPLQAACCRIGAPRFDAPLLAPRLLPCAAEEEWPDAKEIKAARRAEEEAKTPIPERCWALRNVAGARAALEVEVLCGAGRPRGLLGLVACRKAYASAAPARFPSP